MFLSFLLLDSNLHSLKFIKTILNLEHNLISLFFFTTQLLSQMIVLSVCLFHSLLIFICDWNDLFNGNSVSVISSTFLIDWNHTGNFLLECDWLCLVFIHDLCRFDADSVKMLQCLRSHLFILKLWLKWGSVLVIDLWRNVFGCIWFHFLRYFKNFL